MEEKKREYSEYQIGNTPYYIIGYTMNCTNG